MTDEPRPRPIEDHVLDGNAVAGLLEAAFGVEMTERHGQCAHCGARNRLGSLRAYTRAPGTVLRCPICEGVVLRIVETDRAVLVDLRGASYVDLPREG
jgi:hypothetical protein